MSQVSNLVTGGAGFIASSYVRQALDRGERVVVLDALTYAGHLENLEEVKDHPDFRFVEGRIEDSKCVTEILSRESVSRVLNFAAESHVDRSIAGAQEFIQTNIKGTYNLLQCSLEYYESLKGSDKESFRFLQVSTDEVFGELGETGAFTEETPYQPKNPYSATKAAADHLARAWFHTFGLPVIVTNCSNNYGPRQFPEKLIPHMIRCALTSKPLPVYGEGKNVRDWIHVEDHTRGIHLAVSRAIPGSTYCFGGRSERRNLEVVERICEILDEVRPRDDGKSYSEQISFVTDRKGHDWRYAIDDSLAVKELGFEREFGSFEQGLKSTIQWYLDHERWVNAVLKESGGA